MSVEDLLRAWEELAAAEPAYRLAEAYYEGEVPEIFASEAVRARIQKTGERYRFNFARTPVDTLADRLELLGVSVPDNEAATERAQEVWDANDGDVHEADAILRALEYGDAYVMAWPVVDPTVERGDTADDSTDDALLIAGVEHTVHLPIHCRVMYDLRTGRRKEYAIKRWPIAQPEGTAWRADLYYRETIEEWWCPPGQPPGEPASWVPHTGQAPDELERPDGFDGTLENPTGEIPFFHYRTSVPYGIAVHRGAYGPQDAITKALATQICTMDAQGFPFRYGLVSEDAALSSGRDHPGFDDDFDIAGDTRLNGVSGAQRSNRRAEPGRFTELEGLSEVGQLEAAEPGNFLDPAALYLRAMAQISKIPLHYFDPAGDVPSGESLKVAEAPLTKWCKRLQALLRSPISERWVYTLRLLGMTVQSVEPRWAAVASATGVSDWQEIKLRQESGVPIERTLTDAGFDPEDVAKWLDDDTEAMDLTRRVSTLQVVADAVQKMSGAVTAGVLDKESLVDVLNKLWPELELEAGEDPEPVVDPVTGLPTGPPGAPGGKPPGNFGPGQPKVPTSGALSGGQDPRKAAPKAGTPPGGKG